MGNIFKLLIVIAIGFALFGLFKPAPGGTSIASQEYMVPASNISFFEDVTYVDEEGTRFSEQEIFDEVFAMIDRAEHYILLDMFLFNDFLGTAPGSYRQLSRELTNALVAKKNANPDIIIVFITDPINTIYGSYESPYLAELREAGVEVLITDLSKLKDSNPFASGFWRAYFSWFGNSTKPGLLPNPFDERLPNVGFRTYASLLNFKANHRKLIVADYQSRIGLKFSTLITSANPHDGSSAHTNTALVVDDHVWKDVIASEVAVARFSGGEISEPPQEVVERIVDTNGDVAVQILTEEKIRDTLLEAINRLTNDDSLDMAMFYLSDRKVVQAIKKAKDRGAKIRLLLDPNKDAFGREKNGIPNRQVAFELTNYRAGIDVRWCHTHGEQCHTKMTLFTYSDGYALMLGSANLTRRNIGGYNLETNVYVESKDMFPALQDAHNYFEKVWNNEEDKIYSIEYATYKEESYFKSVLYRFMEDLGTSSF